MKCWVIVGPTGVGKSAKAIELAQRLQEEAPTIIISADSRQIYQGMTIGTAAVTTSEMRGIPHFLVNTQALSSDYSAGQFVRDCNQIIEQERATNVIIVGGSLLYIKALLYGLDRVPKGTPEIRSDLTALYQREGIDVLRDMLQQYDPEYLARIDARNHQRMIRALEVYFTTGIPFTEHHRMGKGATAFVYPYQLIGYIREREELYERINQRVEQMFEQGLLQEVERLAPYREHNALRTIGYREVFDYLDGKYNLEICKQLIAKNSRVFARRQLTSFAKLPNIRLVNLSFEK